MIEVGGGDCFRLETGDEALVAGKVRRQDFESDDALQGQLPGLVDSTHAAAPQFGDDFVAGKLLTRRQGHQGRRSFVGPGTIRRCLRLGQARISRPAIVRRVRGRWSMAGEFSTPFKQTRWRC
jgi:hypothetical protein